tara:strand:- start:5256 stop:7658 length:2403 start_codon:yes stop_codon:yes gene_type:complete
MNETASLLIRADSKGVVKATSELDRLETQGKKTERATDGVSGAFSKLAGAAATIAGVTAAVAKLTSTTVTFQKLRASLEAATGSADRADVAFQAIQDFATQTPYDLAQATEGFLMLVNLGLTPSERAMESYGNTASALGKDLNQMIGAVADAATGEFERLKEFGIRAKNEGDTIKFTFQGVTTEVKNNAAEIEGYLMGIGETQFAGQMEKQMETLGGAISNFQDEFEKAVFGISEAGAGQIIEDAFRLGIDALEEFNAQLASGQLQANIDAIMGKFSGFAMNVSNAMQFISDLFEQAPEEWSENSTSAVDFIIGAFADMPENIRAAIQLIGVEIASLVDYGSTYGQAMLDVIVLKFDQLAAEAKVYGKSIANSMNPFSDEYDFRGELDKVIAEYSEKTGDIWKGAQESAERVAQTRRDSIGAVLSERDAALQSFEAQSGAADKLREDYERLNEERKNEGGDKLAQFKVGGDDSGGETESATAKEYDKLVKSLRSEEQAIADSYEARKKLVIENTEAQSEAREKMLERIKAQRDKEYSDLAEDRMKEVEKIRESLLSEEEAMLESYERRREIILSNEQLTEEQRQELLLGLQKNYVEQTKELERERTSAILQSGEDTFGALAGLAKTFEGEQSKSYKALFAVSQGFALADATMKMYQAIQAAWASAPFPANLPAVGIATASTAANVASIAATSFSGMYDKGGDIPAGKWGIAGEIGPEVVTGPARVIGRKDTEKLMSGKSGGDTYNVNSTNVYQVKETSDKQIRAQLLQMTPMIEKIAEKSVLRAINQGGAMSKAVGRRTG